MVVTGLSALYLIKYPGLFWALCDFSIHCRHRNNTPCDYFTIWETIRFGFFLLFKRKCFQRNFSSKRKKTIYFSELKYRTHICVHILTDRRCVVLINSIWIQNSRICTEQAVTQRYTMKVTHAVTINCYTMDTWYLLPVSYNVTFWVLLVTSKIIMIHCGYYLFPVYSQCYILGIICYQ